MPTERTIAIGLGSNINAEKNLRKAAELLKNQFSGIHFSSVYKTAPQGKTDQDDFLNAVAVFQSDQSSHAIAMILRSIEADLGKNITERFGPRTIDLDILLYGDTVIDGQDLQVPHPRMHERRFVLEPLCELMDGRKLHPKAKKSLLDLLENTRGQTSDKLDNMIL